MGRLHGRYDLQEGWYWEGGGGNDEARICDDETPIPTVMEVAKEMKLLADQTAIHGTDVHIADGSATQVQFVPTTHGSRRTLAEGKSSGLLGLVWDGLY